MATKNLTGGHPLLAAVRQNRRESEAEVQRWLSTAGQLLADHRANATSYETLYRVDEPGRWERIGPAQDDHNRWLASTDAGRYVSVSDRNRPFGVAGMLAGPFVSPATALLAAAELAAPAAAYVLAVAVHAGGIEWDTGETVTEAARRLALDAAWGMRAHPLAGDRRGRDVFDAVLDDLNVVLRTAGEYGSFFLEHRDDINATLADRGIEWGGALLDAGQAADRAGISRSAWTAHVARSEAPGADESTPSRWRPATVDAWRHTRRRRVVDGW